MAKPDPRLLDKDAYPAKHELMTRFQDMDPNQHINNVAMCALFEDLRVRFDFSVGLRAAMRDHGFRSMIVSLGIEFLGEAFYPEPIVAYTGALAVGRTSWEVGAILTQGDTICAYSRSTMVGMADGSPFTLPPEFRATLERNMIRLDQETA